MNTWSPLFDTVQIHVSFEKAVIWYLFPDHWEEPWTRSGLMLMTAKHYYPHPCSGMVPLHELLWEQLVSQYLIHLILALLILWRVHLFIRKSLKKRQILYRSLKHLLVMHQAGKKENTSKLVKIQCFGKQNSPELQLFNRSDNLHLVQIL